MTTPNSVSRNSDGLARRMLYDWVTFGGKRMRYIEALLRHHVAKAIQGEEKSLIFVFDLIFATGCGEVLAEKKVLGALVLREGPQTQDEWFHIYGKNAIGA